MSAADPLDGITARVAAVQAAMLEAAIDLGASADALQAQVAIGDVLPAQVLPPQNGQDAIALLGQRVAAQLPPGLQPGETVLLQVTGLSRTQIFVRNLGPATAGAPAQSEAPPRTVFAAAPAAQVAAPAAQVQAAVHSVEARIAAAQAARTSPASPPRQPASSPAPVIPVRAAQAVPPQNPAVQAVQRAVETVSELLRAARLPDTPFTRMAATIAPHAPERVPSVLQRLEAALPRASQDARIPTLRTLIAFTARLNPANADTLRAQISSYVSNVVEGVETKLTQLLQAHSQTSPAPVHAEAEQTTPQNPQPLQRAVTPAIAQARVAERAAAISHDLKSVVLSLLRNPPAERTPALSQALSETLMTLTGAQVHALSANQQNPGTYTLTLPVYYHEGGKPAQIRISRERNSRGAKMDADNFHVGFVLDTANLGTVAIDLQTTGRAVKVDVKTHAASAAARFSDTLSSLRERLESLRYRVASAAASVLSPVKKAAPDSTRRGVDLRA